MEYFEIGERGRNTCEEEFLMRKVSMWVIGLMLVAATALVGVVAQTTTPTQPEVRTQTPGETPGMGRRGGHRGQRGNRMARIDADKDGKISREEWPRDAEIFAKLDANTDGFLTRDEMKAGKGFRGDKGPRGRRGFGAMDQNSDGQITREEWKGQAEMFDRLDTNKDGMLKADELKGRHRKGGPEGGR